MKKETSKADQYTSRMAQLNDLGLKFNGQYMSFILKDINVHTTEIQCDSNEQWEEKINKIKKRISENRKYYISK